MVVLVIAYGTLYPFVFHARPDSPGPLRALAATYPLHDSRSDIVANILLYIPFGFFAIQVLRRPPGLWNVILVTLAGTLLSFSGELLQYYIPGRDSSIADIVTNTTGGLLGAAAGMLLYRKFSFAFFQAARRQLSGVLILACWLGYRLFPYVPVIDPHQYWHAVRPLLVAPVLPLEGLYRHTVIWLALAVVLEELSPPVWKQIVFPVFMGALLFVRILIVDVTLSPAEVAGGFVALVAWFGLLAHLRVRKAVVAVLFAVMVIIAALEPFQFSTTARPFTWVPFQGFLHGSLSVNIQSFFEKSFQYGCLLWLAQRAGCTYRLALLLGGGLVLGLHFLQVYLPGRSAEISDVLILLIMGGVIKVLDENDRFQANPGAVIASPDR